MSRRILWYEAQGDVDEPDREASAARSGSSRPPGRPEVLAHSERWLVVDKPSGLSSQDTALHPVVLAAAGGVPPEACHRLDVGASGCLLLARDRETERALRTALRKGVAARSHVALVIGAPQPPTGRIEYRAVPDRRRPGVLQVVERGGKARAARYETVEVFRGVSLVRITPLEERSYGARLALSALGTPCIVDPVHGGDEPILLSRWKRGYRTGRGRQERPLMARLSLHCERVEFPDPTGDTEGTVVSIDAPLPKDLRATLRQLRIHAAPGTL